MYDSTSQAQPGYRFQYQVPPKSPALSMILKLSMPASRSLPAQSRPPNPPPMTSTSSSSTMGSRVKSGSKSGPSMRGVSTTTESSMTIISWLICVKKSDIRGSAGASHKVFHSSKTIHRSSRRRDSPCAVVARRTGASWGFEQSPQGLLSRRRAVQAHGSANTAAPSASPRPADVGGSRGSDCLLGPENLGEEVGNLGHGLTRMWQLPAIHGEEA